MAEEMVDVVDEEGSPTGERVARREADREGLWHLTVHVWVYTPQGEVLIQKRSEEKRIFPGKLDVSVGGHVLAGETATGACVREVREEAGMPITENDPEFVKRFRTTLRPEPGWTKNQIHEVFTLRYDGDKRALEPQEGEVDEFLFLPFEEVERRLEEDGESFAGSPEYWQDMIREMKKRLYR